MIASGESFGATWEHFREERAIERGVAGRRRSGRGLRNLSERVIEIPWALKRVPADAHRVLDIGSANAPDVYQRLLRRLEVEKLHLVDRARATLPGAIAHVADVRSMPASDGFFDATICISTLEHIGMDNRIYFDSPVDRKGAGGDLDALCEMGRVTSAQGRVLVTVPAGEPGDLRMDAPVQPGELGATGPTRGARIRGNRVLRAPACSRVVRCVAEALAGVHYKVNAPFAAGLICAALKPARGRSD